MDKTIGAWALTITLGTPGCKSEAPAPPAPTPVVAADAATPGDAPPDPMKALAGIVASCARAHGTVEVRRAGQAYWEPMGVGTPLREGDWVRTKTESTARIRFGGGGSIDLDSDTAIIVDVAPAPATEGAGPRDVMISLAQGSVAGAVGSAPGSDLAGGIVIESDGVRTRILPGEGTATGEFRLTRGDGVTEVSATRGAISLVDSEGTRTAVKKGRGASVRNGRVGKTYRTLTFPRSISPGIDAQFHCAEDTTVRTAWKRVPKARAYKIQVARDLGFADVVVAEKTRRTMFSFKPPGVGMYAWRVAAVDRRGVAGEYGFARRVYCVDSPIVDLLVAPRDGAKFAMAGSEPPTVVFSWMSSGDTTSYRFALASGDDPLSSPLIDRVVSSQRVVISNLKQGRYSWGVYADSKTAIFTSPRKISVGKQARPKANTKGLWD